MDTCCFSSKFESQDDEKFLFTESESEIKNVIQKKIITTCKHYVPIVYHEPHIITGFRPTDRPWSYYFKSIFYLHNESVNIWSHLIAFFIFSIKLYKLSGHYDFLNDNYTWPLLGGLFCGMILFLCSSGAHCLQSKSEIVHHIAFMFDYAGIGLYGLGSLILHLEYTARPVFKNTFEPLIIYIGSLFAVLVCFCCCISKTIYQRPYPFMRKLWQIIPVGTIYIILFLPVADRIISCFLSSENSCPASLWLHIQQVFWFMISGFFFSSKFPQSIMPAGRCDIFFHSHQIFHIVFFICSLKQIDAVLLDFEENNDEIRSRLAPTFFSAFGPIIFVIFAELLCNIVFAYITIYKLLVDKKK